MTTIAAKTKRLERMSLPVPAKEEGWSIELSSPEQWTKYFEVMMKWERGKYTNVRRIFRQNKETALWSVFVYLNKKGDHEFMIETVIRGVTPDQKYTFRTVHNTMLATQIDVSSRIP